MEETEKSLSHLGTAVALGMKDKELIHGHDALAFVRIQPEFEDFVSNGYKYRKGILIKEREEDVLGQLNKLKKLNKLRCPHPPMHVSVAAIRRACTGQPHVKESEEERSSADMPRWIKKNIRKIQNPSVRGGRKHWKG